MAELQSTLAAFCITVNNRPYLGESTETVSAAPRHTGWTGKSPEKRSRILLGDVLSNESMVIHGRRNLRSHLERIMAEADAGLDITKIEITKQ